MLQSHPHHVASQEFRLPASPSNTPSRWEVAPRQESLSWSIVRQIRDALFSGRLAPGEFLGSEITLAQEFGVSRVAAREALRSLIALGIVEVRMGSRGGAWVAAGNSDRLVDALSVQLQLIGLTPGELLEAQSATIVVAAELAAQRATEDAVASLQAAAAAVAAAAPEATTTPSPFIAASLRFRECIVEATRNRVLLAQYRAFETVLGPLLEATTTATTIQRVVRSNRALIEAISRHDASAAADLMREREARIRTRVLRQSAPASKTR